MSQTQLIHGKLAALRRFWRILRTRWIVRVYLPHLNCWYSPTSREAPRRRLGLELLGARIVPATLIDVPGAFALNANNVGLVEAAVPLDFAGTPQGDFQVVQGNHRVLGTSRFPETFVSIISNTYVREAYQKVSGAGASYGSSLIASWSYRTNSGLALIPTVDHADASVDGVTTTMQIDSHFGAAATQTITQQFLRPTIGKTVMNTTVVLNVLQPLDLGSSGLAGSDALRALTVSSMFTNEGFDANFIQWLDPDGVAQRVRLNSNTPRDSHLFSEPQPLGNTFWAIKEPGSAWFGDSPSLQVSITQSTATLSGQVPLTLQFGFQGFLANGTVNDDTLSLWPEIRNLPATIPAGSVLQISFSVTATPPRLQPSTLAAPKLLGPTGVIPVQLPTISWSPVYGADHYQLHLFRAGSTVPFHRRDNLTNTSFTPDIPLPQGTWIAKIRSYNSAGAGGPWSAPMRFIVDVPLPAPAILTGPVPDPGASAIYDPTPTVTWQGDADHHELRVDDLTTGRIGVVRQRALTGDSFTLPNLAVGHRYRFLIRAVNEVNETSSWATKEFQIEPCRVGPTVLDYMQHCRGMITYAPRNWNPNLNKFPTLDQIRADLKLLYAEGWRAITTYSLDGTLAAVPRIAKELGFWYVQAGLFWFDAAQLGREWAAALAEASHIDSFILGNEPVFRGVATPAEVAAKVDELQAATGKPVGTNEPGFILLGNPSLLQVGSFTTVNIHPFVVGIRDVAQGVQHTFNEYQAIVALAPGRFIAIKEGWWPSSGDPAATPANQVAYFKQLAATGVYMFFGEAFDQPFKSPAYERGFGWHTALGVRKPVVVSMTPVFTGGY